MQSFASGVVVDQTARRRGTRPAADLADSGKGFLIARGLAGKAASARRSALALLLALPARASDWSETFTSSWFMPCWLNMSRSRCIWFSRASRTPALGLAKVTWVWSAVMWMRTSRRPSSAGSSWISADFRFWLDIHITRSTTASLQPFCCIATGWPGTVPFTGRLVRPVAPWPGSAR